MKESEGPGFLDIFGQLDDPRMTQVTSPAGNTLLGAVICGSEDWNDIELFGWAKLDWLRRYLAYQKAFLKTSNCILALQRQSK